jgi:hypothetical protein
VTYDTGVVYTLVIACLRMLCGSLADRFGSVGFVHASRAAWAVLADCGVMVMLLGVVSAGRWALATAERNGARLATDVKPSSEGAG